MNRNIPQPLYQVAEQPVGAPIITNAVPMATPAHPVENFVRADPNKPVAPKDLYPLFKGSTLEEVAQWIAPHIKGYSETYPDRVSQIPRTLMNLIIRDQGQPIFENANMTIATFCLRQERRLVKGATGELDGTKYKAEFLYFTVPQPSGYADCRYFKYNQGQGMLIVEVRQIHNTVVTESRVAIATSAKMSQAEIDAIDTEQVEMPVIKPATGDTPEVNTDQQTLPTPKGSVKPPMG